MAHDDLHERFGAFGWNVIDVADGNDIDQLKVAFDTAKTVKGRPYCADCQYGERKKALP